MAHRILDLTQETTTSEGTGALVLAGATADGFTFADSGMNNGDTFWGLIKHATANEKELTLCTYSTSGPSITRASVPLRSTTGSKIAFSAGTKYVSLVAPASKTPYADADGNFVFLGPIVSKGVREIVASPAIVGGVLTLDCAAASVFEVALNANITSIVFSNPPAAGYAQGITVRFTADGTPRTVAQPASVLPTNGTYTPSSTNGKRDRLAYWTPDGGTTWEMLIVFQNV